MAELSHLCVKCRWASLRRGDERKNQDEVEVLRKPGRDSWSNRIHRSYLPVFGVGVLAGKTWLYAPKIWAFLGYGNSLVHTLHNGYCALFPSNHTKEILVSNRSRSQQLRLIHQSRHPLRRACFESLICLIDSSLTFASA